MNEIEENASAVDEESNPTLDSGQVTETEEVQAETLEVDQDFFDPAEYTEKSVKLQVDGQEVVVPLKEALAGYQRQADYTRKTQELSEQRKQNQYAVALQEALQNDPAGTLKLLQDQYSLDITSSLEEEDVWMDPTEKQVKDLEKRLVVFEQQRAMEDLTKAISSLQSKYGDDFDADEVVARALATGSTDLETTFKQVAFDKIYSKGAESAKKLADEQARLEAKRGANIVSSSASSKSTSAPQSAHPKTVLEAFKAAQKELSV